MMTTQLRKLWQKTKEPFLNTITLIKRYSCRSSFQLVLHQLKDGVHRIYDIKMSKPRIDDETKKTQEKRTSRLRETVDSTTSRLYTPTISLESLNGLHLFSVWSGNNKWRTIFSDDFDIAAGNRKTLENNPHNGDMNARLISWRTDVLENCCLLLLMVCLMFLIWPP